MRVFLIGCPGDIGGANTEAWHTIKLWRRFGLEVHVIPTWSLSDPWIARLSQAGCTVHRTRPEDLERVPDLPGSVVVGLCNRAFIEALPRFRAMGCPVVWANCMTFLFEHERAVFAKHGLPDACVFQSDFQRGELEPKLLPFGYRSELGHLVRGAFDFDEWEFRPRPHGKGEPFVVGRVARPDRDKWSSNTWPIYGRIQYRQKRALMLGMDERTHGKLGKPPTWADCLRPLAIPTRQFFANLHATLPINGGARENWPRAGLEAMAAGVPIIAQDAWGWREMVDHGVTGFLTGFRIKAKADPGPAYDMLNRVLDRLPVARSGE